MYSSSEQAGPPVLELSVALQDTDSPYWAGATASARHMTGDQGDGTMTQAGYCQDFGGEEAGYAWWAAARKNRGAPQQIPRVQAQLRQLLDFYFEPFNMQHNRYILDVLAKKVQQKSPARGPWSIEQVARFAFSLDDLIGLGRISSSINRIRPRQQHLIANLQDLRYLKVVDHKHLCLRDPCEARRFITADGAPPGAVANAIQYLCAVREEKCPVHEHMVSVMSYSLAEVREPDVSTAQGQQRRTRLRRQLLLYHTDFVCLQGLDAGSVEMVKSLLTEEQKQENCTKYEAAFASGDNGMMNAILWDASRWRKVRLLEEGSALSMDVELQGKSMHVRMVCMSPDVGQILSGQLTALFDRRDKPRLPLIACSDLSALGGVESASLVEELAALPSAMQDVLGQEVLAYVADRQPEYGIVEPVCTGASELWKLHSPDAIHYDALTPLVALSGHSEFYLATLMEEEVPRQFPAFHLPLVAAFSGAPGHDASTGGVVS